jgi:hypothetical protein
MEIVLCTCNWDIPGVDALPPHMHRREQKIRRTDDGTELWVTGFVSSSSHVLVDEIETVRIPVNWKMLARTS